MKNVKLKRSAPGWFLTIGDDYVKHQWAVTSLELWTLKMMIEDNIDIINEDIEKVENKSQD